MEQKASTCCPLTSPWSDILSLGTRWLDFVGRPISTTIIALSLRSAGKHRALPAQNLNVLRHACAIESCLLCVRHKLCRVYNLQRCMRRHPKSKLSWAKASLAIAQSGSALIDDVKAKSKSYATLFCHFLVFVFPRFARPTDDAPYRSDLHML